MDHSERPLDAGLFCRSATKPTLPAPNHSSAKMPPVNTGLLDGSHEDRSNMNHFIAWASKLLKHRTSVAWVAK